MKKDDIEEIYSELESFSKAPPKELWDNIEERLHPKRKKRRVLFLWGSAAAVLVIFLGYMYINTLGTKGKPVYKISDIEHPKADDSINEPNKENTIIIENSDESAINHDSTVEKSSILKKSLNTIKSQQQLTGSNEILKEEERRSNLYEKNVNFKEENTKYNNSYSQNSIKEKDSKIDNKAIPDLQKKNKNLVGHEKEKLTASIDSISKVKDLTLLDKEKSLLANNENDRDSIKTNALASSKWSVEILGGLTNTNPSQSSIQSTDVNTISQNDFVYALKVGYSISDRLIIKSGIGKNILGQEINNVKYISSDVTNTENNPQSIVSNQNISILVSQAAINDISTTVEDINEGNIEQKLDYIQVPLEFSYSLLKGQKYNLSLGAGGNINFLTSNRFFLDNEYIGENLGVNPTIFGVTINSSISYELIKKTILFLEPSYNYFDKPISNNNQMFNNTQLRILFGIQYKF